MTPCLEVHASIVTTHCGFFLLLFFGWEVKRWSGFSFLEGIDFGFNLNILNSGKLDSKLDSFTVTCGLNFI